jgi:uncharacterized repeat protein (TIGR03803 family)
VNCRASGGCGTLFQLTEKGALTSLYNFCTKANCADGEEPQAAVIQAGKGLLYGTTFRSGANDLGTVYSWSFTVLPPTFKPDPVYFGSQALNTTSTAKTITMTNPNADALTINSITPSAGFAVSSTTCGSSLPGGKPCQILIAFTPTKLGKYAGTLTVADSAPNSPQTVPLIGTGVAQVTLSPTSLSFATQAVGTTSAPKVVTLTNNLSTAVTITGITFTGTNPGDYAQTNTCGSSVAAKAKCTISVTFTPHAAGTRTATLNVADDANNSPQRVALTGTGK